jgi:putative transposase
VRGRHTTRTTWRDQKAPRHPDLVQRGWSTPRRVDELWVADFSYVWTLTGFVYVAFVVDVFSRRILGWRVSTSKQTPLVTDALHQALTTRRISESRWNANGLVHHSNAGTQHVAGVHRRTARTRHGRIHRHRRRRPGQRPLRIDHRPVQDRSHPRRRTNLGRPPRRRVPGRPLGPLVTTPNGSTPPSGTCPPWSSNTITGRLRP